MAQLNDKLYQIILNHVHINILSENLFVPNLTNFFLPVLQPVQINLIFTNNISRVKIIILK